MFYVYNLKSFMVKQQYHNLSTHNLKIEKSRLHRKLVDGEMQIPPVEGSVLFLLKCNSISNA